MLSLGLNLLEFLDFYEKKKNQVSFHELKLTK